MTRRTTAFVLILAGTNLFTYAYVRSRTTYHCLHGAMEKYTTFIEEERFNGARSSGEFDPWIDGLSETTWDVVNLGGPKYWMNSGNYLCVLAAAMVVLGCALPFAREGIQAKKESVENT